MRSIGIIIVLGLFMNCVVSLVYAQDPVIKQKICELELFIDKEPAFSFRDGMQAKIFFQAELRRALLLAEDNKPEEVKKILYRLIFEMEGRLAIADPRLKEEMSCRLIEVLAVPRSVSVQE